MQSIASLKKSDILLSLLNRALIQESIQIDLQNQCYWQTRAVLKNSCRSLVIHLFPTKTKLSKQLNPFFSQRIQSVYTCMHIWQENNTKI